jgi:hypothetical protein
MMVEVWLDESQSYHSCPYSWLDECAFLPHEPLQAVIASGSAGAAIEDNG